MGAIEEIVSKAVIPRMVEVEQRFEAVTIEDYVGHMRRQLEDEVIAGRIREGMTIAITAGSRGIYGIANILRGVVDFLKEKGAKPFLVTAMGSHGGATVEGQLAVLDGLGITPASMGVDVVAGTDSTLIETLNGGIPVMVDTAALAADAIVVVNRIKPHTGFRGIYESGLMKMLAIGLGNHHGATYIHSRGLDKVSAEIGVIAKSILKNTNVLFGVAILENCEDKIGQLHVIPAEDIPEREPPLLCEAQVMLPELYFKDLDLLIVDRIGKNISGGGMDVNIVGGFQSPGCESTARPQCISILDLTDETHGAAFGMGDGDTTTRRLFDKIDFDTTYPNCLITCTPRLVKIPMVLPNQKLAIQAAIKMLLSVDFANLRVARICDTLHIDKIWISEALVGEAERNPNVSLLGKPEEMVFDAEGNLF